MRASGSKAANPAVHQEIGGGCGAACWWAASRMAKKQPHSSVRVSSSAVVSPRTALVLLLMLTCCSGAAWAQGARARPHVGAPPCMMSADSRMLQWRCPHTTSCLRSRWEFTQLIARHESVASEVCPRYNLDLHWHVGLATPTLLGLVGYRRWQLAGERHLPSRERDVHGCQRH
jgi:hypothetical protein